MIVHFKNQSPQPDNYKVDNKELYFCLYQETYKIIKSLTSIILKIYIIVIILYN